MFVSRPGYKIADIDYSQIELRIPANVSGEPLWVETLSSEEGDLHSEMAKLVYSTDSPTGAQRQLAKRMNFSNLNGGSPQSLVTSDTTGTLSLDEARRIHSQWWNSVPVLKEWANGIQNNGTKRGWTETCFGRKRSLMHLISKGCGDGDGIDFKTKMAVRRVALNTYIQGSAADIMKMAMVRLHRWVKKEQLQEEVKILLQVHDELVFEIREDVLDDRLAKIVELMERQVPGWRVPLTVDVDIGDSWGVVSGWSDSSEGEPEGTEDNGERSTKVVDFSSSSSGVNEPEVNEEGADYSPEEKAAAGGVTLCVNCMLSEMTARLVRNIIVECPGEASLSVMYAGTVSDCEGTPIHPVRFQERIAQAFPSSQMRVEV